MGLIDSIVGAESSGDPNAKNPNSSASGLGQFIDSTWLDTLKTARPDLAQGKSDQELLALKSDPQLSRQMTEAYANQNGQKLTAAGFEATPANTYLAHFAGPQGALSILGADPSKPVSEILTPAAVAANPFLKGMSAGDLQAWASRKMGGGTQPQPQNTAPAAPQIPANAPLQPSPQVPPIFPAAAPQQAPQQQAQPQPQMDFSAPPAMSPIFADEQRPIDISRLRAALQARGNSGLSYFRKS